MVIYQRRKTKVVDICCATGTKEPRDESVGW